MYELPYFKDGDGARVMEFIRQHPFAFIAGATKEGKPVATQVPVFMEEREGRHFLSGHMMRKTDHHLAFEENPRVLCVFTGPHAYVSATWYKDPHQASTWNYMSVQAAGRIAFLGEAALVAVLQKTSLYFEGGQTASSTVYENLPPAYTERLIKAIVAFEIEVSSIAHVFKLSQNRDAESYRSIIEKLEGGDANAQSVAAEMKLRAEDLFRKGKP